MKKNSHEEECWHFVEVEERGIMSSFNLCLCKNMAKFSGHTCFPCSVITAVKFGYYNTTRKCDCSNSGVFSHEGMVADCVVHSNRLSCLPRSDATVLWYGMYGYLGASASLGLVCYLSGTFGWLRRVPARNLGSRKLSQTSSTTITFTRVERV